MRSCLVVVLVRVKFCWYGACFLLLLSAIHVSMSRRLGGSVNKCIAARQACLQLLRTTVLAVLSYSQLATWTADTYSRCGRTSIVAHQGATCAVLLYNASPKAAEVWRAFTYRRRVVIRRAPSCFLPGPCCSPGGQRSPATRPKNQTGWIVLGCFL